MRNPPLVRPACALPPSFEPCRGMASALADEGALHIVIGHDHAPLGVGYRVRGGAPMLLNVCPWCGRRLMTRDVWTRADPMSQLRPR